MNDPPTAVGGIPSFQKERFGRLDINHPPTAVGGISPDATAFDSAGATLLSSTSHSA